jgi:hypothetical protein
MPSSLEDSGGRMELLDSGIEVGSEDLASGLQPARSIALKAKIIKDDFFFMLWFFPFLELINDIGKVSLFL